jgi:predicted peptidase
LVVFPQSSEVTWSAGSNDARRALTILQAVCRAYAIDEDRIYLTGLSMGGAGTWGLAKANPGRWAALIPVCGFGNPEWGAELAHIPCWCFHGAADEVVPVERSREMVEAIKGAGGIIRYTEYPDMGHNSWDRAYETDELYDWLLQQRRSTK